MRTHLLIAACALLLACGSSNTKIRSPLTADQTTTQAILKGAKAIGCTASGPDDLIGIMVDCPDGGRIVFGHDSGEGMRPEKPGEPYPIEVMCFRSLASKCQETMDRILAEGRK